MAAKIAKSQQISEALTAAVQETVAAFDILLRAQKNRDELVAFLARAHPQLLQPVLSAIDAAGGDVDQGVANAALEFFPSLKHAVTQVRTVVSCGTVIVTWPTPPPASLIAALCPEVVLLGDSNEDPSLLGRVLDVQDRDARFRILSDPKIAGIVTGGELTADGWRIHGYAAEIHLMATRITRAAPALFLIRETLPSADLAWVPVPAGTAAKFL
jgi:hypothetical protein